jgi:predicted PurR-regulated permease PerM
MSEVFIPFVLAGLLFYALDPLVDRLQRWRIPRAIGAAVAVVFLLGSVGAIGYSLLDDVDRIAASVPDATQRLRGTLRELRQGGPGALDRIQRAATAIAETAKEATGDPPRPDTPVKVQVTEASPNMLLTGSTQMIALGGQAIMVVFLSYFLLLANDLFKRKLVENFGPTLAQKKVTVQILNDIAFQIERFLLVQVFTSVLVAVATTLALWSLGVQQPGVWGLAAGILNSVPYFGPVIVTPRVGARRICAVRYHRDGVNGGWSRAVDHDRRRLDPHADIDGTRRSDEHGGHLCRTDLLELDVGARGSAARSPDHDDDQGDL